METRASYLLVGGFVVLFALGLLFFVVWLAKFQFDTDFKRYDVFFTGSVTGLQDGSPVRYSGVRVGEVVFIGLDHHDPNRVRALIEVESITPITEDTVASLEIAGLTGGRYILLSGGSSDAQPLVAEAGQKRPVIPSRSSQIESILEGAPELLENATALLVRANQLLGPDNQHNIAEALANVARVTGALAQNEAEISQLIRDGGAAMASFKDIAGRLSGLVDRADATMSTVEGTVSDARPDLVALLRELRVSAKSFGAMSEEIRLFVAGSREPFGAFAENGLQELTLLLTEARDLILNLNRVTTEVERDPARFLFGNQQQGYEAPR